MTITRSDAITLEIIQSSLQAISDEMFSSMRKTVLGTPGDESPQPTSAQNLRQPPIRGHPVQPL
jgi:hypothetical protein